ncbi:condensation domain-containing protein, partial [Pseudomonas cichorii]|uniref:condensation domain-containing protein n=1 Tax=Pseudomonas cichorii TaxID=36746 RepID=UPI0011C446F3
EALNAATWDKLRQSRNIHFYNMYGPTECTVDASLGLISELGERPSIGKPLANMQVLVLDRRGQPVPVGVTGELHIGGAGVARGYLNNPQMTAERFFANPFSDDPQARLYKTGDLGRWKADGSLEYAGRNDFQVKIRGFRIELGEIESALLACPAVREAVVIAREDNPGENRLVAYVCGESTSAEELRALLLNRLPEYMIPSAFVQLEAMPLTANGKLDRRALPAPGQEALASRTYEAPQGEVEQAIAQIWQDLLHVERVGRNDGFLELGGHSLLAVQLLSRLRRKLGTRLTLRELFDAPTVRGLAARVESSSPEQSQNIPLANRKEKLALSFSQQRLWFLDHLDPAAGAAYHLPVALRLNGQLDADALQAALDRLVARHEILRTAFALVDGQPEQRIAAADRGFALSRHDLRERSNAERQQIIEQLGESNASTLFDLGNGPLLRGCLIQTGDTEHVLFITLHHIISDGWSNSVLAHEISVLYSACSQGKKDPLPALPLQYADYAVWQRQWLQGAALQAQTDFWRNHLQGAPALLNLPLDRPRPALQSYAGGIIDFALPAALSEQLRTFSQAQGSTLFMTLLAGWSTLMTHLSGQDDVVVGTPVANRQRAELEPLIGFFANTLALRVKAERKASVARLLIGIKDLSLAAFNHQDLPFEQVVSALQPTRSMSHSPLFQVMFSLNNTPPAPLTLPDLQIEALESAHHTTQFDLSLSLTEDQGSLYGSMQYASDLFDKTTVQNILDLFSLNLEHLVADAQQPVDALLAQLPPLVRGESAPQLSAPAQDVEEQALPFAAPQGDTELAIARIWQELFKTEQISRHDDFFKLGGISLMAVQMTSRLRKVLGKPIAVRDLFVEPTVAGFARTLEQQAGQATRSNLVPIRRNGSQRPLFLVHPLGGEVQYARDLAPLLDSDLPVYGLAASGFNAGEKTPNTIPALAASYLTAIRALQPKGPYRIAGWSAGGLIAHEMAHQALAAGETVEFLGIIDTSVHKVAPAEQPISEEQFLLEWLPESIEPGVRNQLNAYAADNRIEQMLELCLANDLLPQELGKDIDARSLRTHLTVAYAIRQAVDAYVSPVTDVHVSLFTAMDQPRVDPTLGWSDLQGERLQITALRGEHNTLVMEPHVRALAEAVSLALKRL